MVSEALALFNIYKEHASYEDQKVPVYWDTYKQDDHASYEASVAADLAMDLQIANYEVSTERLHPGVFTKVQLVYGGYYIVTSKFDTGRVYMKDLTREQDKLMNDLHRIYRS